MKDVIFAFVTISLVLIDLILASAYTEGIRSLLEKNRFWIYCLLFWMGILAVQTALYSWLPGRIGAQITVFDGMFVFEDGALIRNLGNLLLAHALAIGLALLKYLWNVLRKKDRFYGKMFLLEAVICGILCFFGIRLIKSEYVVHFEGGQNIGTIVMAFLAVAGAVAVVLGFRQSRTGKENENAGDVRQSDRSATSQAPSKEAIARFDQIVAEKNRLTGDGDYASQIPLLIEAAGLDVDATRRARIWNYMGLAYNEIGSEDKALECFRTAQGIDPGHPSSYVNIAEYYTVRREYDKAIHNADTAITMAKNRKMPLGQFYARYALITGLSGDLQEAEKYLNLAGKAGCDDKTILSIQNRILRPGTV